jgi:hypothetical protein
MNNTQFHQLILSVREQIQDDLIVLLEEEFGEVANIEEIQDLACGLVVTNFNSLIEGI